jgi:hypothetical protein
MGNVAERIFKALGPLIRAGREFGSEDSESCGQIGAAVDRFVYHGDRDELDQDFLELYDMPGVEEYAARLNARFNEICSEIIRITEPS